MKKFAYMAGAFILGIVAASSAGTVSAQVKSLIGQKVTGEYTVFVDGKELSDKGAVINGKTNAPVRALSEALGVDLKVEGKVIRIATSNTSGATDTQSTGPVNSDNKYIGDSKESLLKLKSNLENDTLKILKKERDEVQTEIETLKKLWDNPDLSAKEKQLKQYDDDIAKYTKELEQVEEALKLLEQ
ncbi:copper amine oxidase [Paenibacillus segetis]|uniref:Copper amine oxidase N-terminal domain-containing protein n=1 Tax=Paenibacillus segetis TaxID=1325360 RepID=A0ABQ1Y9B0_9BACL|nr:copper amine oxidase [Paenibacillus segetis]GGH17407.1 hypothetical protein GCM10008013_12720 [Paenibacillus segetis]